MGTENTNLRVFSEGKNGGNRWFCGRMPQLVAGFNPEAAELGDDLGIYLSHRAPCQILVLEELPWERGSGSYRRWESRKGAAGN